MTIGWGGGRRMERKDLLYNRKTKIRNRCECGATQTFVMDGAGMRGRFCMVCRRLIRREPKPVILVEEEVEKEKALDRGLLEE